MNQLLKSNNCFYLDDFNIIRFVSDKTFKINSISLYYEYEEYPLELDNVIDASLNKIYFFKTTTKINPRLDYKILLNGSLYRLFVGDITLKESFDEEYYFNDWLGYKFNKNSLNLIFKIISYKITLANFLIYKYKNVKINKLFYLIKKY